MIVPFCNHTKKPMVFSSRMFRSFTGDKQEVRLSSFTCGFGDKAHQSHLMSTSLTKNSFAKIVTVEIEFLQMLMNFVVGLTESYKKIVLLGKDLPRDQIKFVRFVAALAQMSSSEIKTARSMLESLSTSADVESEEQPEENGDDEAYAIISALIRKDPRVSLVRD